MGKRISLDKELRSALEETIDNFLNDAERSERHVSDILREQGIEPNLETVLSYIAGIIMGWAMASYAVTRRKAMNTDEGNAVLTFMKRRAYELREAFIKARIKR